MPFIDLVQRHSPRFLTAAFIALLMLMGAPYLATTAQAETVPSTPVAQIADAANPAEAAPPGNSLEKNNLGGFFLIGAIINILFMAAFIYWAVREMRKSKQKKASSK